MVVEVRPGAEPVAGGLGSIPWSGSTGDNLNQGADAVVLNEALKVTLFADSEVPMGRQPLGFECERQLAHGFAAQAAEGTRAWLLFIVLLMVSCVLGVHPRPPWGSF
ncbi:hypothetical protein ACFWBI_16665 [Streptomyces sp. NPDC059982]|uniref:hypothetical protein n=1 Tax=unclassified Streptomyces TaxID=2593676 RepID=UPI00368C02B1